MKFPIESIYLYLIVTLVYLLLLTYLYTPTITPKPRHNPCISRHEQQLAFQHNIIRLPKAIFGLCGIMPSASRQNTEKKILIQVYIFIVSIFLLLIPRTLPISKCQCFFKISQADNYAQYSIEAITSLVINNHQCYPQSTVIQPVRLVLSCFLSIFCKSHNKVPQQYCSKPLLLLVFGLLLPHMCIHLCIWSVNIADLDFHHSCYL